ncbi:MAG: hypothetical protein ACK4HE_04325 [Chitinophagaceae bacterium]
MLLLWVNIMVDVGYQTSDVTWVQSSQKITTKAQPDPHETLWEWVAEDIFDCANTTTNNDDTNENTVVKKLQFITICTTMAITNNAITIVATTTSYYLDAITVQRSISLLKPPEHNHFFES